MDRQLKQLIAAALILAGGTALSQDDRDQYCRVVHPNGSRPEVKIHLCVELGEGFAEQCLDTLTDQLLDQYCAGSIGLPELKALFHLP